MIISQLRKWSENIGAQNQNGEESVEAKPIDKKVSLFVIRRSIFWTFDLLKSLCIKYPDYALCGHYWLTEWLPNMLNNK